MCLPKLREGKGPSNGLRESVGLAPVPPSKIEFPIAALTKRRNDNWLGAVRTWSRSAATIDDMARYHRYLGAPAPPQNRDLALIPRELPVIQHLVATSGQTPISPTPSRPFSVSEAGPSRSPATLLARSRHAGSTKPRMTITQTFSKIRSLSLWGLKILGHHLRATRTKVSKEPPD